MASVDQTDIRLNEVISSVMNSWCVGAYRDLMQSIPSILYFITQLKGIADPCEKSYLHDSLSLSSGYRREEKHVFSIDVRLQCNAEIHFYK